MKYTTKLGIETLTKKYTEKGALSLAKKLQTKASKKLGFSPVLFLAMDINGWRGIRINYARSH